ncbi:glyoxalase, partial [Mesorhizobium sp. M8A.F.Ca.ET.023.02.2.1]
MPTTTEAPRLYPALRYKNAAGMIDWLGEAFGFSVRARYGEGDVVHHAELVLGSSMIMLGTVRDDDYGK